MLSGIHPSLEESDFTPGQLSAEAVIEFDDPALEKKVRAAIGKKKGEVTYGDVSALRELYASFEGGKKEEKIRSIAALRYFTALFKFEAVAQEITVDPIKTVGSDNVTFQAFMYFMGWPLIGGAFRRLKTV